MEKGNTIKFQILWKSIYISSDFNNSISISNINHIIPKQTNHRNNITSHRLLKYLPILKLPIRIEFLPFFRDKSSDYKERFENQGEDNWHCTSESSDSKTPFEDAIDEPENRKNEETSKKLHYIAFLLMGRYQLRKESL